MERELKICGLVVVLLLLEGCSSMLRGANPNSICATQGEASYACQVERYHNVEVQ